MQIIQQLFTLSHSKKRELATSRTKVCSALRLSLLHTAGALAKYGTIPKTLLMKGVIFMILATIRINYSLVAKHKKTSAFQQKSFWDYPSFAEGGGFEPPVP